MTPTTIDITVEPPPKQVPLSDGMNTNWDGNAAPVAVLNHASSIHDRVAYAWELACALNQLSDLFEDSSDPSLQRAGSMVAMHIRPLVTVLDQLGNQTAPRGGDTMSLTIAKNEDLHLTKKRGDLCLEAMRELVQLADLLPTLTGGDEVDEMNAGFLVRGVAARIISLSEASIAALSDEVATTEALRRKVLVLPFGSDV